MVLVVMVVGERERERKREKERERERKREKEGGEGTENFCITGKDVDLRQVEIIAVLFKNVDVTPRAVALLIKRAWDCRCSAGPAAAVPVANWVA